METRVSGFSESQREYLLNWFKQKAEMDRVSEEAYRRKKIEKKLIKKGEKKGIRKGEKRGIRKGEKRGEKRGIVKVIGQMMAQQNMTCQEAMDFINLDPSMRKYVLEALEDKKRVNHMVPDR